MAKMTQQCPTKQAFLSSLVVKPGTTVHSLRLVLALDLPISPFDGTSQVTATLMLSASRFTACIFATASCSIDLVAPTSSWQMRTTQHTSGRGSLPTFCIWCRAKG